MKEIDLIADGGEMSISITDENRVLVFVKETNGNPQCVILPQFQADLLAQWLLQNLNNP